MRFLFHLVVLRWSDGLAFNLVIYSFTNSVSYSLHCWVRVIRKWGLKCNSLAFANEYHWLCRQKQYFEQRKQQQQQQQDSAFAENNVDNFVTCDHQKRNRSLDISSLLSVSKVTEECKPLFGIYEKYLLHLFPQLLVMLSQFGG